MIPDRLLDENLKTKNPNVVYIFCILFRVLIGLLIYFNETIKIPNGVLYILYIFIIGFFSFKLYTTKNDTWKEYNRTLISYSIAGLFTKKKKYNDAGLLIIIDSLIGLTSRHIQNNFIN